MEWRRELSSLSSWWRIVVRGECLESASRLIGSRERFPVARGPGGAREGEEGRTGEGVRSGCGLGVLTVGRVAIEGGGAEYFAHLLAGRLWVEGGRAVAKDIVCGGPWCWGQG